MRARHRRPLSIRILRANPNLIPAMVSEEVPAEEAAAEPEPRP